MQLWQVSLSHKSLLIYYCLGCIGRTAAWTHSEIHLHEDAIYTLSIFSELKNCTIL